MPPFHRPPALENANSMTAPSPTPDALLFELLDLLPLAFPRPVDTARVEFQPGPTPERACLGDLSGSARDDAPDRPELGFPDEEILDTLNVVVGDLIEAVGQKSGGPLVRGYIERQGTEDDGAFDVWVVETTADGEEVVRVKRRVDQSEQHFFVQTPALYRALNDTEATERKLWEIGHQDTVGAGRYALEPEHARLAFLKADGELSRRFAVALLGTYHPGSATFVWGWANDALPKAFTRKVDEVRRNATAPGLRAFVAPEHLCPPPMAERLIGHAAVQIGANGIFPLRVEQEKGGLVLFLALFDRD